MTVLTSIHCKGTGVRIQGPRDNLKPSWICQQPWTPTKRQDKASDSSLSRHAEDDAHGDGYLLWHIGATEGVWPQPLPRKGLSEPNQLQSQHELMLLKIYNSTTRKP
eukprot:1480169-Amphidinium_carterae.1